VENSTAFRSPILRAKQSGLRNFIQRGRRLKISSDKRGLLPLVVVVASASILLGLVVLGTSLVNRAPIGANQQAASDPSSEDCSDASASDSACFQGEDQGEHREAASEPARTSETVAPGCSGDLSTDFACLQRRYQDLVRGPGVGAAFTELKNELTRNELASSNCHELTHIIGHAAAELYGDVPTTYSRGDSFCGSGYYHGAMEAIVTKIGADKVLEEADTLCAGLYSFDHYNCAHGLGHGFMRIQENELFESLEMCDVLTDGWEEKRCYGGVFMENVVDKDNPVHPSKYLKADRPLYPCDVVGDRYKDECYQRQSSYALETRGNDFAKGFDLCAKVEDDFRPACYQGLGWDASVQSLKQGTSDLSINEATRSLCALGKDQEAQFNCAVGAVDYFIRDSYSDARAKAFCVHFGADLRAMCLREAEEYYGSLRSSLERQGTSS